MGKCRFGASLFYVCRTKYIWLFANFGAHSAQLQNSLRKFYIKC